MPLWIPITIAAAFLQNLRSTLAEASEERHGDDWRYIRPLRLRLSLRPFLRLVPEPHHGLFDAPYERCVFWLGGNRRTGPDGGDLSAHTSLLVQELRCRHGLFPHRACAGGALRAFVPRGNGDTRSGCRDRREYFWRHADFDSANGLLLARAALLIRKPNSLDRTVVGRAFRRRGRRLPREFARSRRSQFHDAGGRDAGGRYGLSDGA